MYAVLQTGKKETEEDVPQGFGRNQIWVPQSGSQVC